MYLEAADKTEQRKTNISTLSEENSGLIYSKNLKKRTKMTFFIFDLIDDCQYLSDL